MRAAFEEEAMGAAAGRTCLTIFFAAGSLLDVAFEVEVVSLLKRLLIRFFQSVPGVLGLKGGCGIRTLVGCSGAFAVGVVGGSLTTGLGLAGGSLMSGRPLALLRSNAG